MKDVSRHQTWQEPIKQVRNSGQLFRPSWDSLTYGGWVHSTSGQSKLSHSTKTARYQSFSSQPEKIKTMQKLLWPLLTINLRIPGSIWRVYFVQNETTTVNSLVCDQPWCKTKWALPGDTRRTTSELPCRTPRPIFQWREMRSLEKQNALHFSLHRNWHGFGNCKSLFVNN